MSWTLWLVVALLVICVSAAHDEYYSILGLKRSADKRDIKRAYRKLSLTQHPDKGGDTDKWAKITQAYEVLQDAEKRRIYDQYGEEGLKQQQGGRGRGGGGMFDSFFDFFGGGRSGGGSQGGDMPRGANIEFPLEVTLADLYIGRQLRVTHQRQKLCHNCRGTGADSPDDMKQCSQCKGRGAVVRQVQLAPGFVTQTQQTCPACDGKGKTVSKQCHVCHGKKVEAGQEWLTLYVERGMKDGSRITFEGQGDEAPGSQPGDLIFVVVTDKHPRFARDGDDLHLDLRINLIDALTGFSLEIEHLDGHKVTIANKGITIPNQTIRIEDEGMPIQEDTQKGDLLVHIEVEFPESLTPDQQQSVKQLLEAARWKR